MEGRHPSSDPNHGRDDAGYDSEEEERALHHQDMYMNGGRNHHFGRASSTVNNSLFLFPLQGANSLVDPPPGCQILLSGVTFYRMFDMFLSAYDCRMCRGAEEGRDDWTLGRAGEGL